jgi:hypothetical protein
MMAYESSLQETTLLMSEARMAASGDPQITKGSELQSKGVRSISDLLHQRVDEPALMAPAKWRLKWMRMKKPTSSPG